MKTLLLIVLFSCVCAAQNYPAPEPGDFLMRDFKFQSGESLPELRVHYVTLGKAVKDKNGNTTNAVLILHGTGGSHASLLRPSFAGALFGKGQLLDAEKYFIVIPDNIGHGASSKPSDGLRAKFPHYNYHDLVTAQYRLLTERTRLPVYDANDVIYHFDASRDYNRPRSSKRSRPTCWL